MFKIVVCQNKGTNKKWNKKLFYMIFHYFFIFIQQIS